MKEGRGKSAGAGKGRENGAAATPGKTTRVQAAAVQAKASRGVENGGDSMPFLGEIQRSFGHHDVGEARAHTGGEARSAAGALGTEAYTIGADVAFASASPDLHTAAHEAAHVVQQQRGVSLPGQLSSAGDRHEQHADAVADAVVRGESAAALLDSYSPSGAGMAVQASGGALEAPAPGEGGVGYAEGTGEMPFTPDEQRWIDDVLRLPAIQLILQSYELPVAVLHRVQAIGGASGQFSPASDDIAIADRIYNDTEETAVENDIDDGRQRESNEESFKGTLLHELFHFFEHNAVATLEGMVMPGQLVEALVSPTRAGYEVYEFGWFVHPVTEQVLHFQIDGVLPGLLGGGNSEFSVRGTALEPIAQDRSKWESSPMPISGGSISPEEDLCESFSLMFVSERTMREFETAYPKRFDLINRWLGGLDELRQEQAE